MVGGMCVPTLNLGERQRRHEPGDPGILDGALSDDRDELLERYAFEVDADEGGPKIVAAPGSPESVPIWRASVADCSATPAAPGDLGPGGLRRPLQRIQEG
jgi:hypothetical protein